MEREEGVGRVVWWCCWWWLTRLCWMHGLGLWWVEWDWAMDGTVGQRSSRTARLGLRLWKAALWQWRGRGEQKRR